MGQNVKILVEHLRKREEEFGVNAFHFQSIQVSGLADLQRATYPAEVQAVIEAGKDVRNWPKASDIPTDPVLKIIVKEVEESDAMEIQDNESGLNTNYFPSTGISDDNPLVTTDISDEPRVPTTDDAISSNIPELLFSDVPAPA